MRAPGLAAVMLVGFAAACSSASGGSGLENSGGTGANGSGGSSAGTSGGAGGTLNLGGSSANGNAGFGASCNAVKQTANNGILPADVIWAVDNSCSMQGETAAVQQNMNQFSTQIVNAGVDVHIVLLSATKEVKLFGIPAQFKICIDAPLGSGTCPSDSNLPRFAHIDQPVASTDALSLFISTYPKWKQQLRSNAIKIFVVVTDDNSDLGAAQFTNQVNNLDPATVAPDSWKFYSIHCFSSCPSAANVGTVYTELVSQTQGVSGDLCLQDFKPVFDQLAGGIVGATKLSCAWGIPPAPAGQTFDKGLVNVVFTDGSGKGTTFGKVGSKAECGSEGGWYYDSETDPHNVLACDNTCQTIQADPNGAIDVAFGCQTVIVPH